MSPVNAQEGQLVLAETEVAQRLEEPARAGEDAVAATVGQPAGEGLEDAGPVGVAAAQRGLHHRQLVVVRQQGGARVHGPTLVRPA
jgi:hypothetical protein